MNYYAFSGLVIGLISTICGGTVYFNNYKSRKNKIFGLYSLSLAFWGYFYCAWQLSSEREPALFLVRILMMGAIWIPILHYHLILSMFDINHAKQKYLLKTFYCSTAIIMYLT